MADDVRIELPDQVLGWSITAGRRMRMLSGDQRSGAQPADGAELLLALPRYAEGEPPRRLVVVALKSLPCEEDVLVTAAEVAVHLGDVLAIRHAVPRSYAERSVGLGDAVDHGHLLLATAGDRLAARRRTPPIVTEMCRMWPHELVGESIQADLLVLGGPRAGAATGLGLVARSACHHAPCPVLLVGRLACDCRYAPVAFRSDMTRDALGATSSRIAARGPG